MAACCRSRRLLLRLPLWGRWTTMLVHHDETLHPSLLLHRDMIDHRSNHHVTPRRTSRAQVAGDAMVGSRKPARQEAGAIAAPPPPSRAHVRREGEEEEEEKPDDDRRGEAGEMLRAPRLCSWSWSELLLLLGPNLPPSRVVDRPAAPVGGVRVAAAAMMMMVRRDLGRCLTSQHVQHNKATACTNTTTTTRNARNSRRSTRGKRGRAANGSAPCLAMQQQAAGRPPPHSLIRWWKCNGPATTSQQRSSSERRDDIIIIASSQQRAKDRRHTRRGVTNKINQTRVRRIDGLIDRLIGPRLTLHS
jgi:hypothetical protein